mmetsp:Transcript_26618/g.79091  ORF Transcript_26618/g.79091 Transcript_26618/m.79091 type:complete len:660 (-) Transcript_26618:203-2182(-)
MNLVDLLVLLERLRVRADAPVTRRHHEAPLDLLRLDARRQVKVWHRLLVDLVLDVVGAEPRDDVHIDREHTVRLLVEVQRPDFVVEARMDRAKPCEHSRVVWHERAEHLKPLDRVLEVAEDVVHGRNLVDDLGVVGQHRVQLLERGQRALVLLLLDVQQPQVVDRLDTVGLDASRFNVQSASALIVLLFDQHVGLVDICACIVSVALERKLAVLVRLVDVALKAVQECEVGRGARLDLRAFLLKFLEDGDGALKVLFGEELGRLGQLHLVRELDEAGSTQLLRAPVEARLEAVAVDLVRDELRTLHNDARHIVLALADHVAQPVVLHDAVDVLFLVIVQVVVVVLLLDVGHLQQAQERVAHALHTSQRIRTHKQVVARLVVWHRVHDDRKVLQRVLVLAQAHKCEADVALDFEPDLLGCCRNLVERHAVHLDRGAVPLLLEVDVAHVDAKPPAVGVLLVLHQHGEVVERLLVVLVGMEAARQVELHRVREVDVDLLAKPIGFAILCECTLALPCLHRLLQRGVVIGLGRKDRALLQQQVHLLLHLVRLLLWAAILLLQQLAPASGLVGVVQRVVLALVGRVAGALDRGHGPRRLRAAAGGRSGRHVRLHGCAWGVAAALHGCAWWHDAIRAQRLERPGRRQRVGPLVVSPVQVIVVCHI